MLLTDETYEGTVAAALKNGALVIIAGPYDPTPTLLRAANIISISDIEPPQKKMPNQC